MWKQNRRQIWMSIIAAVGLLAVGTTGIASYEHLTYGESFYRTVMLLLTRDNHFEFHSNAARTLAVSLVLASYVLIAYLLKWFAEYMIGLSDNVRSLRVKTQISRYKNHYIVCGLGRVGFQVAKELHNEGVQFVALDRDKAKVEEASNAGFLAMNLDSTEEEALKQAGIDRAAGLVSGLSEDSSNLLVTLTAKALNPNLIVVARANRAENEVKLKRAGADRVVLPYQIGGFHMASMVLRPSVVDYMELEGKNGTSGLEVEEMIVAENSQLAGRRLGNDLTVSGKAGATVIAINGADGTSRIRPDGTEIIYPGDRLIILGAKQDLTDAASHIR
jgi:voltage-gated potassium channel